MARKRFNFWLDDKRTEDWSINEIIANLKKGGQFTRAIREGLRLWVDLRANKTDVLFELFPQLKSQITPVSGSGGGHSELAKEIAAQIILQGGTPGYMMQSTMIPMKNTVVPPVAEIKQTKTTASADEIATNFLSMFD